MTTRERLEAMVHASLQTPVDWSPVAGYLEHLAKQIGSGEFNIHEATICFGGAQEENGETHFNGGASIVLHGADRSLRKQFDEFVRQNPELKVDLGRLCFRVPALPTQEPGRLTYRAMAELMDDRRRHEGHGALS
ncbi:MAG: hypothetical protein VB144_11630 [Clostridia bacterium]|nr:hypothetical protein [Clostridia bacterium]